MDMIEPSKLIGISSRDAFGLTLAELAQEDNRIVALTADLAASVRLADMMKVAPERVFNFGIAEQDMMGAAAGFALTGKIPFVTTFAVFASLRAAEQARQSWRFRPGSWRRNPSCTGRYCHLSQYAGYDSHRPRGWN
jgi:deoxyxylulose-5-phosphate synthase